MCACILRYLSESDFDELPTAIFNAGFALIINNCYDVSSVVGHA